MFNPCTWGGMVIPITTYTFDNVYLKKVMFTILIMCESGFIHLFFRIDNKYIKHDLFIRFAYLHDYKTCEPTVMK